MPSVHTGRKSLCPVSGPVLWEGVGLSTTQLSFFPVDLTVQQETHAQPTGSHHPGPKREPDGAPLLVFSLPIDTHLPLLRGSSFLMPSPVSSSNSFHNIFYCFYSPPVSLFPAMTTLDLVSFANCPPAFSCPARLCPVADASHLRVPFIPKRALCASRLLDQLYHLWLISWPQVHSLSLYLSLFDPLSLPLPFII